MSVFANFFNIYGMYVVLGLLLLEIATVILVLLLKNKFRHIFRSDSLDIDRVLVELRHKEDSLDAGLAALGTRVGALEAALPKDIRKVGLVRYNPFSDAGGDQSFALALLNSQNDGIIISSLYGREMNRVYAKRIEKGGSTYPLTDEEKEALYNAQ